VAETGTRSEAAPAHEKTHARFTSIISAVGLVIVAIVALTIGSLGRSAPTVAQRAAAIESRIKCPSCEDISVAQSEAPTAIAARHQIVRMVKAGATDAAIEQSFVNRYGPSILLAPPVAGLDALVWVLPLVAVIGALGALGVLFWRRQRALTRLRAPS
jgi:cytochrome c-type biogenesis protein CcmH